MNIDSAAESLEHSLQSWLKVDWLGTAITAAIIVVITAIVAHIVTLFLKKILKSDKGPLPALSIFLNIGRVTVWLLGVSVLLSTCFNIDVGGMLAALGVGGIAISLGFQETLSNLIGGLQIILTGLVEPGDRIRVSNHEGIVHDVTWRHTTIITVRNEHVVIPNSVINTDALIKLPPETEICIDIVIKEGDEPLSDEIPKMESQVESAVEKITAFEKKPKINVYGVSDYGYRALLTFSVVEGVNRKEIIDSALKSIAGQAIKHKGQSHENYEKHHSKLHRDLAEPDSAGDEADGKDNEDASGS